MKLNRLIYLSIVVLGAIFGFSCDCDTDYVDCPKLEPEFNLWLTTVYNTPFQFQGDSGSVLTVEGELDSNIVEPIAECHNAGYGACSCDLCGNGRLIVLNFSDSTLRYQWEIITRRDFTIDYDEEMDNVHFSLNINNNLFQHYGSFSNSNVEFLPTIHVNGIEYREVYLIRNNYFDGSGTEPGYVMLNVAQGIISFYDEETRETFYRQ